MNAVLLTAATLLALSKHHIGGIIGIVAGVVVIGLGALRVMQRAAGAMILAFFGIIVIILGVLVYARTI